MSLGINREASEARTADLRRSAGRDAIALAELKAAERASARSLASRIRDIRQLLDSYRIRSRTVKEPKPANSGASCPSELLKRQGSVLRGPDELVNIVGPRLDDLGRLLVVATVAKRLHGLDRRPYTPEA